MTNALATAGWILSVFVAAFAWRLDTQHKRSRETLARGLHELRGSLTAAGLALAATKHDRRHTLATLDAVDLQLRCAAGVVEQLDDIDRCGPRSERIELVELDQLVDRVVRAQQAAAGLAWRPLRFVPEGRGALVLGAPGALARATMNLVANALEHGAGVVVVSTRLGRECVRLEVSDQGVGLPVPVARLAARPRHGLGRRGRGLAIASEIAANHGGRLAAAPVERGARLVLELPVAERDWVQSGRG